MQNMKKHLYENADIEIIALSKTDVIRTSGGGYDVPSGDDVDDNWITP